mgnify:CR=1 FL=1
MNIKTSRNSQQLNPTLEEISDLKTAVLEAVTNCIVHAYPDALGRIVMKMKLLIEAALRFRIAILYTEKPVR